MIGMVLSTRRRSFQAYRSARVENEIHEERATTSASTRAREAVIGVREWVEDRDIEADGVAREKAARTTVVNSVQLTPSGRR